MLGSNLTPCPIFLKSSITSPVTNSTHVVNISQIKQHEHFLFKSCSVFITIVFMLNFPYIFCFALKIFGPKQIVGKKKHLRGVPKEKMLSLALIMSSKNHLLFGDGVQCNKIAWLHPPQHSDIFHEFPISLHISSTNKRSFWFFACIYVKFLSMKI